MKIGDIINIPRKAKEDEKTFVIERVKYRVLEFYPHFILCQHCKAGYRECFSRFELYEAGVLKSIGNSGFE